MSEHIIPAGSDLVLVSDIHLKSPEDERGQLLIGLIQQAKRQKPKHFILLGDIFDFCLGSTDYFKNKFAPIGKELTELAKLGSEVTFFEGNHEFELPKLGWEGVDFVGEGTKEFLLRPGFQVRAAHGDLVHATLGYRVFRGFLKSRPVTFICTHLVPSKLLDWYALSHAKVSRASDHYRQLKHHALFDDATKWMKNAQVGLIGHFHTPYYEMLNQNQMLLSVRDWSDPNFLVIQNNTVLRGSYKNGWHLEPAEKTQFGLAD